MLTGGPSRRRHRAARVRVRQGAWSRCRASALWFAGPVIHLFAPGAAWAQDYAVGVPEALIDSEKPKGLPLGSFTLLPRVNFDLRQDSNIYNQPNARDDTVAVLRPGVRLDSNFSRHALRIDAAAEGRRYFDTPEENSNQWAVQATGRLDFASRYVLTTDVGAARRIERRGTFGDQFFTDRPVSYDEFSVGTRLSRMGGVIEWQAGVSTRKLSYNDARQGGLAVDQSFRDVRRDAVSFRIDYNRSSRLGLFARATGTRLDYDLGRDRNSKGFSILGGASYQVTDLVTVEAGVGYVKQNTRSPTRPDISAVDYHALVQWTPTTRTRFALRAERTVERSPLAVGAAVLQSTITGSAAIAVGSRTLIGLEAGFLRNSYDGFDRRESRLFAEATVRHQVARGLAAFVGVSGRTQRGSGINPREYDGAAVRLGVSFAI